MTLFNNLSLIYIKFNEFINSYQFGFFKKKEIIFIDHKILNEVYTFAILLVPFYLISNQHFNHINWLMGNFLIKNTLIILVIVIKSQKICDEISTINNIT